MRIYVVRHGETENNAGGIRQSREGYLSEEGIQQARALAQNLSEITIDSIFTSTYPRAKQTADIISSLGKKLLVQESEYLTEIKLPSEIVGKPKDDAESLKIFKWVQSRMGGGDRYSDEETYNEYVSRAYAVLEHISKTGFRNVVVVTHHRFIHILVSVILLGRELTPRLFAELRRRMYVSNTGVTILEQNLEDGGSWRLLTLNEHSHIKQVATDALQ
ncbi:histidine phosphatase family protein [Patescibacteria group bacterium]|nr:histidine phosphatase family protein [Patescibacteria group bacterium]